MWTRPEHWLLLSAKIVHRAAMITPDAPFMPGALLAQAFDRMSAGSS